MPRNSHIGNAKFMAGGQSIPLAGFVSLNPQLAAATSKAVKDTQNSNNSVFNTANKETMNPVQLTGLSTKTAERIKDAETVKAMLPDIQMALDILVSSIISPNDMMKSETIFNTNPGIVGIKADEAMHALVREYFTDEYPIARYYIPWLQEILGKSGAKVLVVLPESTIDDVINSDLRIGLESQELMSHAPFDSNGRFKAVGYLGASDSKQPINNVKLAIEALRYNSTNEASVIDPITFSNFQKVFPKITNATVEICDNSDILKMPLLQERLRERKKQSLLNRRRLSTEADDQKQALFKELNKLSPDRIRSLVYRERKYERKPVVVLKSQSQLNRRTIGAPTIMEINTEAFIPLHAPGKKDHLLGGFIILDSFGYPINLQDSHAVYEDIMGNLPEGGATSEIGQGNFAMQQNQRNEYFGAGHSCNDKETFALKTREYAKLVEDSLVQRLKNGIYPDGVEIAHISEIGRVMLARSLSQQQTTLLFVPSELVTYMAFDYDGNGMGRSLLDTSRIVNSQRIQMKMANMLAALRNSIGLTDINVKLDEDTVDGRKAIMQVTDAVMAARSNQIPTGMIDPPMLEYFMQRQGLRFAWEGAIGLPDVKIDYSEVNTNYAKPDTDLEEALTKQSHQSLRVPTELIDSAQSPDFATVAAKNSIMFSKNVQSYQDRWTPQLTKHSQQIILADQMLYDQLREIVKENYKFVEPQFTDEEVLILKEFDKDHLRDYVIDKVLTQWIEALKITLPSPDNTVLSSQLELVNEQSDLLDKLIESYLSTDLFSTELVGEGMSGHIDIIAKWYKATAMRQFFLQHNILPEIQDLFAVSDDEEETNVLPQVGQFIDAQLPRFLKFLAGRSIVAKATDTALEKSNIGEGSGDSSSDSSSDDSGDDSGEGGDDSGEGGDDFNFDDSSLDVGGGDEAEGGDKEAPAE